MGGVLKPDLRVDLGGLKLKNPVMTASGTFGYGLEFGYYMDISKLGAVIVKGLSLKPREGNPPPRTVETPCGMLNSIGLQNVGVDEFIKEKLPPLRKLKATVIANIFGETISEYEEVARRLDCAEGVSAIEINISCPNVKKGGILFGTDPREAGRVVKAVRGATKLHIMTKLSPNVTDIKAMVRAVEEAGTDSVSLINTITGMAIDVEKRRPVLATVTGGLSGPAIRPIAVRMVWEARSVSRVPLIGIGGIVTATDALQFMIAGAAAVQVGTVNFLDPGSSGRVIEGIEDYMKRHGIRSVKNIVGRMHPD
ncbi:MAG TPA: dihydroorotate dehydrogenase [Thermodesulfobacteriota bacterium]|nr:dihydroorotate dehydrogenase [Thermodesulfobacteriota bacterium]